MPGAPEPKESKNYGSFLGGFKPPARGESQGAGSRDRMSENRVGVLDSKNPNSFIRDRSAKGDHEDDSQIDVISVASRRGRSLADRKNAPSPSPNKMAHRPIGGALSQGDDQISAIEHGTPQMGT